MKKIKPYTTYIIIDVLILLLQFFLIEYPEFSIFLGFPCWIFLMITFFANIKNIIDVFIEKKFNIKLLVNTILLMFLLSMPYQKIVNEWNIKLNYLERMNIIENISREWEQTKENVCNLTVNKNVSKSKKVIAYKKEKNYM